MRYETLPIQSIAIPLRSPNTEIAYRDKILLGDCVSEMRKMPSGFIDLIITDPPFAIDFKAHRSNYNRKGGRVLEGYNEVASTMGRTIVQYLSRVRGTGNLTLGAKSMTTEGEVLRPEIGLFSGLASGPLVLGARVCLTVGWLDITFICSTPAGPLAGAAISKMMAADFIAEHQVLCAEPGDHYARKWSNC